MELTNEQIKALSELLSQVKENYDKYNKDQMSYEDWRTFIGWKVGDKLIDISLGYC